MLMLDWQISVTWICCGCSCKAFISTLTFPPDKFFFHLHRQNGEWLSLQALELHPAVSLASALWRIDANVK